MMRKLSFTNRRVFSAAVAAALSLGLAAFGSAATAEAGDVLRPGGQGGLSHGGGGLAHGGGGFAHGGGGFANGGGGFANGGGLRGQRFGTGNPGYGGRGFAGNPYRGGSAWNGGYQRHGYGVGTGLALGLGTGLALGAATYPYGYGYGYNGGYADSPDYAYDPGYPPAGYQGGDLQDGEDPYADGGVDYNGTHYTCSPYEKRTRLQRRACGTS